MSSERHSRALERRALSAAEVHEALRAEGSAEIERPSSALAWSALAAGISMGLSLIAEAALRAHLPDAGWRPLLSSVGYTAGFVAVTLGRQQLFTETTLTATLPLLHERTAPMFGRVGRLWLIVLAGNLAGALVFAWAVARTPAFGPGMQEAFAAIAAESMAHGGGTAFVKGIFGGWIIALMVWLLPSAETARPWVIVLMTYLLAAAGLTHVIAGSLEVFYGISTGIIGWRAYLVDYGLPVLAGNSIGGGVFVALLNHVQVAAGGAEGI